jgi:hypothetical protein
MFDITLPQEEDIQPPCPATNDEAGEDWSAEFI